MAKSLSLTELTALYANKGKNPKALFEQDTKTSLNTILPGASTVDKLNKFFFSRQNGLLPQRPQTWAKESDHNTIAICVIIVDSLIHEDIWRQWVEQGESDQSASEGSVRYKSQLFIHAKHPEKVTSEWVRERLIDVTFRPEWNSVEVVQSLLSVLDSALQYSPLLVSQSASRSDVGVDSFTQTAAAAINTASTHNGACGRFLLATESCLPLYDLQTTGEKLYAEDNSWLQASHTPQGSWEAGACFRAVDADVVPPKAVWKSLPGWVVLTRLHAQEVTTLTTMLGGWGQEHKSGVSDSSGGTVYSNLCDPAYVDSYKGTQAVYWRQQAGARGDSSGATSAGPKEIENGDEVIPATSPIAGAGSSTDHTQDPATSAPTTSTTITTTTTTTHTALLSAWGAGGSWHERNGSVFAPEEMFFPTVLSLLGYLRDSDSSSGTSSGGTGNIAVRLAAVTFAEWQKRGDANPIQYSAFDAHLVTRMRTSGALFGRKFGQGCVTAEQWRDVVHHVSGGGSRGNGGSNNRDGDRDSRDRNDRHDRRNYNDDRYTGRYDDKYDSRHTNNNRDRYSSNTNHRSDANSYNYSNPRGYSNSSNYNNNYSSGDNYRNNGGSSGDRYDRYNHRSRDEDDESSQKKRRY